MNINIIIKKCDECKEFLFDTDPEDSRLKIESIKATVYHDSGISNDAAHKEGWAIINGFDRCKKCLSDKEEIVKKPKTIKK